MAGAGAAAALLGGRVAVQLLELLPTVTGNAGGAAGERREAAADGHHLGLSDSNCQSRVAQKQTFFHLGRPAGGAAV